MYHCMFCGAEIPEDARFCGNCGRTPIPSPDGQTRIGSFHRVGLEPVPTNSAAPAPGSPTSPHWEYEQPQEDDGQSTIPLGDDNEEEQRRRAAMLGMGLLLGAEALPASGNAPMVLGTPQIGGVPSVSNTPGVQGGLSGWHAGAVPHAPGYTPSLPSGSSPTHTLHPPQGHPKPVKPAPKAGCAPLLIVAILIPFIIIGSIITLGFTVFAPGLSLSGSSSVVSGGTLALHGNHFIPGSSVTLTLDNSLPVFVEARPAGIQTARALNATAAQLFAEQSGSNTINAGGDGTFSANISVDPNWSIGQHTIQASESITHRGAQLTFTIVSSSATPTPSPTGNAHRHPVSNGFAFANGNSNDACLKLCQSIISLPWPGERKLHAGGIDSRNAVYYWSGQRQTGRPVGIREKHPG